MKIFKLCILLAICITVGFPQDTWFKEGHAYLYNMSGEGNLTVKTEYSENDKLFYTCGITDNEARYLDCHWVDIKDAGFESYDAKIPYYSSQSEDPNFLDGLGYSESEDGISKDIASQEWIKENGNKIRKNNTEINRYLVDTPIYVKNGIVSVVEWGDEQSTRGENSYTTYKDGKRVKLRVDDRSLYKKINKGFHDSVLKIDENCKFFIFKDKLYVYDPNIEFSYGRYGKSKSYFAFDVPDIEQYLIPVEE
ncbi:MAG: hypothetical protein ACTTJS_00175 [Wolinella sp.]